MSVNFIKMVVIFILMISGSLFSQSFSNKNEIEIPEIFIDTTSLEVIEWGYLDSVKGLYYYEGELYTGPVIKYLSSGLMEGEFLNGLKHGLWQTFNRIGEPLMIGTYDNGKKNGAFKQWYDDGKKRHLELVATFVNDQYDGKYLEWYENGKRSIVGTYKNGREEGLYQEWHENGNKALQTRYIDGVPDGLYREWYEHRSRFGIKRKRIQIIFKDGKENGLWIQWYENGKKEMKVEYVNGIPWGEAFFWFPNGALQGRGVVKSEVPGGGWILEDEGGKRQVYQPEK
tara:strand:- start:78 stop:932 length:855 start_codon:yes stop_codon:yes gene_type:complete